MISLLKIPRRGTRCCQCAQVISDGYYSSVEYLQGEMIRSDYCSICWEDGQLQEEIRESFWWQGTLEKKKDKALASEDSRVFELFDAEYRSETRDEALLHFLAHYLKRRGCMIRRCQGEHEGRLQEIFEEKGGGESYLIPLIKIQAEKLQEIEEWMRESLSSPST